MMLQTGSCHCFPFLFLLLLLHLNPILAYFLKNCTVLYSDNVSAGVSVDCKDLHLFSVPDDIPREVIALDLRYNNIQQITRTDFYHLTNLTFLDLSYNLITHVDDGAFVPLEQLKELCMDFNKLTLTDNMFQGLSNLLILDLDGNDDITSINPAAFQSLTSLQELSLMSTDILTILKLPKLQVLNIKTEELKSFQSKDLPLNMSSELRELRVDSRSIKMFSITTAVFPHLKTIDLSYCCSYSGWEWDIPDKYFLRNITTLYLSGGGYGDFNDQIRNIIQALQNLDSLVNLGLRFKDSGWIDRDLLNIVCKIPTLRTLSLHSKFKGNISETLSPCTQLTSLDLSDSGLTELSNGSIKHMNQLSHLNLANNQLSRVPDDVKNLSMLQILDLRDNLIENLGCSDFLNLTRITHLHLDQNNILRPTIQELKPCVFQHLKELKVLTLYGCGFTTISKGLFMSLKSLKQLKFSYAGAYDPWNINSFEGLDELEKLSLDFKYTFKMTSSPPQVLQWQHNNTTLLPKLKSLTVIFGVYDVLHYPFHIHFLWDMLSDMKHLEHIAVVVSLGSIVYREQPDPDSFKHVPQLKSLSLINCNLTSLDFLAQAYLPKLSWLDLSQNELMVIDVVVFSFLPALMYIKIDENPLACDCSNADFQQWMQNKQTQVVKAHRFTCAHPLDKKGTRFLDFDYHSCLVDSFICFIFSTCVIVLTLLTSFTCHFLSLHLLYAYYLFLAFFYDAIKGRKRGSPERYDAFISYNVHDELWVCREMLPVLEGEQGWRLCLHHRDFLPGKPITENIADAIYGSRKTICVISHHYLESEWCSREFQMASYRLFDEQKDVLILVFLEDIPAHQLSPYYHMRRLVKSHTYLSWSQAGQNPGLFWQNLRRALDTPHTDLDLNQ